MVADFGSPEQTLLLQSRFPDVLTVKYRAREVRLQ